MTSTRLQQHIKAPRAAVYRALISQRAVGTWMVPSGAKSQVHAFDGKEGGTFRISLTYEGGAGANTYRGRFTKLVMNSEVVEVVEFETTDPEMQGEMTITFTLTDAEGGTEIVVAHDNLPRGLRPIENEATWRSSLTKLARYVEAGATRVP